MWLDPQHLSALSAILRLGSFEAAAAELAVTPSAISQRIKALEDRVGATLIHRGTPCVGTEVGMRISRHADDIGLLEAQLERELTHRHETGPARVRIAVPADALAIWFINAMKHVDGMLFDLVIDDQDHSAEWLRRGEVSAAVTVGGQSVTGCDAFALGNLRYLATASPEFVTKWFAHGATKEALARAPCLTFNQKDNLQMVWIKKRAGARLSPPTHFLPSTQGFLEAAASGLGWGMNPEPLARPWVENGNLQEVIPDAPLDVPLTWQVGRILAPALAPLTRSVRRAAAEVMLAPD
ncbi:MAG: LysR family transcriptional regulator ArgP [Ruegeria sp.]